MPTEPTAASVLLAASKVIGARLASSGFKRERLKFIRRANEIVSLIELQSSRSSTRTDATYVINCGVVCRALFEPGSSFFWTECHWRERVNDAAGVERWHAVRATDDPKEIADRTYDIVKAEALPRLERLQTNAALAALWKSGEGPGLTDGQRLRSLGQLSHHIGDLDEVARCGAALERLPDGPFVRRAISELAQLGK